MKTFNIPDFYRSHIITPLKEFRRKNDKLKRDFTPTVLDFGPVKFLIARHFGFCYGVENAIEIAYKALSDHPDKRIFLLSEMIHNPDVNRDLQERGMRFIMDTAGQQLIDWAELNSDDIVVVPAFGTTIEIQKKLADLNIDAYGYDTTCPFVEKVWNRAAQIGQKDYTVVIHGKPSHEETRATFSHVRETGHTVVVKDMAQTIRLSQYMIGNGTKDDFYAEFAGQFSEGFDPTLHLQRIGVVNQTTMLASDTQGIADYLKNEIVKHFNLKPAEVEQRFANTRDTLCYATNDNQDATYALLTHEADLAIVAGGYNSSNTAHIVELCEQKLPTYFIDAATKILDKQSIEHFDLHNKTNQKTNGFMADKKNLTVMLTCGASCPDAVVEQILVRLLSFFPDALPVEDVMAKFT